jgi:hypothetical protein
MRQQVLIEAARLAALDVQLANTPYRWSPYKDIVGIPHPQRLALESEADWLGYGGEAGGGKTDLLIGLAERHHHSIIFRRVFPSLRDVIERSREIFTGELESRLKDRYNEQLHTWHLQHAQIIEFAACQYEKDKEKYRGRPHDLYAFDELTEFSESIFRFVTAWNRSVWVNPRTDTLQRCRVVVTFNPPMDSGGEWVVKLFLPWLAFLHPNQFKHPNPAAPGELRWYIRHEDADYEVNQNELSWYAEIGGDEPTKLEESDGTPFQIQGEWIRPQRGTVIDGRIAFAKSRTFIPASLRDNPALLRSGYGAVIDVLPEPLRSLLKGDFSVTRAPNPRQVIPTAWILAAMERWKKRDKPDRKIDVTAADIARGGKSQTVIASLRGNYFDELVKIPGKLTPDGMTAAAEIMPYTDTELGTFVDIIGYGSSAYDTLASNDIYVFGFNGAESAPNWMHDRSGRLKFRNARAAAYWMMREALDPKVGMNIALPDDEELLEDLKAPTWTLTHAGVLIEEKDAIAERLGRSPDCGDAVTMAWYGSLISGSVGI